MAETLNILMTCVGRRVSLVQAFRRTLSDLGLKGRVFVADWSPLAPAFYVADEGFLVPGINAPDYVDVLLDFCRRREVNLVIPLIDTELLTLARVRQRFTDVGARLLLSSLNVVEICRDKRKTFEFLSAHGIGTPKVLTVEEALKGPFPLIVKERSGSSTRNVRQVSQPAGLGFLRRSKLDFIIQEYVRGAEFTIDIYAGLDGVPRVAVPRQRIQVRAGEVSKARTVRHPVLIREAMRLVEALGGCVGVITAQCRMTREETVKFFDVNPRFGGGVPLAIRAGADFPRWIIEEHLGRKPKMDPEAWENDLLMLRYDEAIFRRFEELPDRDKVIGEL